ncbi:hypothetical protein [Dactylosporangium sp. CA-233914]|uniref:hypothetical protein n=1 Tax=Dactylosporangium sp. CA-233914 TaxID=3239934 RepID=UPI003D8FBBB2
MTVEPLALNPCPAIWPVPTERSTVIRRRARTGDIDDRVLRYARQRPAGSTIWLVLEENLLTDPMLERVLVPYVAGLAPAVRRRVAIDTGVLDPPPTAAIALAAAERLAVPVQLRAPAATGADENRIEYRDSAGRPATRQNAEVAWLLPPTPVRDPHLTLSAAQAHDRHTAALRARDEADTVLEVAQRTVADRETASDDSRTSLTERTEELRRRARELQAVQRLAAKAAGLRRQHQEAEDAVRAATALERAAQETLDQAWQLAEQPDEPAVELARRRLFEVTGEVTRYQDRADGLARDLAAAELELDGFAGPAGPSAGHRTADDLVAEYTRRRDAAGSALLEAHNAVNNAARRRDAAQANRSTLREAADRLAGEVTAWRRRIGRQADLTDFGDGSLAMLDAGTVDELTNGHVARLIETAEQALADYFGSRRRGVPPKILDELRKRITLEFVKVELPGLRTATGRALLLGDHDHAVQLRFNAGLRRLPDGAHAELPVRPGDMQSDLRYLQQIIGLAQQLATTYRELPLSYVHAWGMGMLTFLRVILLAVTLRWTFNQYHRRQVTEQSTTQLQVHRLREQQYAHRYVVTWTVTAAEAVLGAPAATAPATRTDPEPLTVWFPHHIARPPGQVTSAARPTPLPQQLVAAEGFHDPEFLHARLAGHYPRLKELNVASLRALLRFVGGRNLRAGFAKARAGGLLSEPLYDRKGKPVGFLRLELPTVEEYRTVTLQRQGWMEMWRRHYVREGGSATIRNATEVSGTIGITGTRHPYEETIGRVPGSAGGLHVGGGIGGFTADTLMADGGAGLGSGLSATASQARPIRVADANLVWLITLVGAPAGAQPLRIDSAETGEPGVRVRHAPLTAASPVPGLFPPAGVEHGGGSGLANAAEFTLHPPQHRGPGEPVAEPVDDEIGNWLKQQGFIAAGPSATDEQLANHRRYLEVTTADHRETAWDELDGHGIWEPFTRTTLTGVQRVVVRWRVRRVGTTQSTGVVEDLTVWRLWDRQVAMDLAHQTGDSAHGLVQGDVMIGVTDDIPLSAAAGPLQYTASADRTLHLGGAYEQESVVASPTGGSQHRTVVRFELVAEIRRQGTAGPVLTAANPQRGSVTLLVPDFRMLTSRAANPAEPPITVVAKPTKAKLAEIEAGLRPATEPPPKLPGMAFVGGSVDVNRLLTRLLEAVFATGTGPADQAGLSAQAMRVFASPARLPGAIEQAMRGVYASDQLFEPGMLSQWEGWVQLRAFPGIFQYRPNHTGVETNAMYIEDTTVASGGSAAETGQERALRAGGSIGPVVPISDHWNIAPQASGGRSAPKRRERSHGSESSEDRTWTFTGDTYTLHAALTYVAIVRGAPRNVLATPASLLSDMSTLAIGYVTVPDALTVHASLGTLVKMLAAMHRLAPHASVDTLVGGLPQHVQDRIHALYRQTLADRTLRAAGRFATGPDVRFLPRWVTARHGLGDATITDVRPRGGHRELLDAGLKAVNDAVPGAMDPGSVSYLPGVHQNLANLVSTAVVSPAVAQWFKSGTTGNPAGEIPLASFVFVTTTALGLVQAEVLLVADATPDPRLRTLSGRVTADVDMENHGLIAEGRSDGFTAGTRWNGGVVVSGVPRGVSTLEEAGLPGITFERRGGRGRGQQNKHESSQRYMQRTADGTAGFGDVPLRLAVRVELSQPDKSLVTGIGPVMLRGISAAWSAVQSFVRPSGRTAAPADGWTEMSVDFDLLQHDATTAPHVNGQTPDWLRAASRFTSDPLAGSAPHPALGSFTAAGIQAWPRLYTEPPAVHRTMVSGAAGPITIAALEVLKKADNTRLAKGAVKEYLSGLGSATLHERISTATGDRRTFPVDSRDPVHVYEEVLTIRPLRATGWQPVTDRLDDGTPTGTPVPLGEATKVNLERFTKHTESTELTATTSRRWSLALQLGWRVKDTPGVVDPKHGATLGNRATGVFSPGRLAAQSGAEHTTAAAGVSHARRAPRLVPDPLGDTSGIGPDPQAPSAHRIMYRHVLFEVTGVTRRRRKDSDTWHEHGAPRRRWVAATDIIRAHHTVLDPPAAPPTDESMDMLGLSDVFGVVGTFAADGSVVTALDGTVFTPASLRGRHTADAVSPDTDLILVPLDAPGSVDGARLFAEAYARTGTGQVVVPDRPVRRTAVNAFAEDAHGDQSDWWSIAPDGAIRPLGPELRAALRERRVIGVATTVERGADGVWRVDADELVIHAVPGGRPGRAILPAAKLADGIAHLPDGTDAVLVVHHEGLFAHVGVRDAAGNERTVLIDPKALASIADTIVPRDEPILLVSTGDPDTSRRFTAALNTIRGGVLLALDHVTPRLPRFATLDGRLIVIGAGEVPAGPVRDVLHLAAEGLPDVPVLVLAHHTALPELLATVERQRWGGKAPVVFLPAGADLAAERELARHGVAVVYPRSDGLNDRWHVEGPGGETGSHTRPELDRALEQAGTLSQAMPAPDRPPAALAAWLRSDDWSEAWDVYKQFPAALLKDDASNRLATIAARHPYDDRLRTFRAILDLARAGHAELAFEYLREQDPDARRRLLLGAPRDPGLPALLAALVRAARRADGRGIDPEDVVLLVATETTLALGRLDHLGPAERKALRCLHPKRRQAWLRERRAIGAAITELAGADADRLTAVLQELTDLVVNCKDVTAAAAVPA